MIAHARPVSLAYSVALPMHSRRSIARALASAFVAGELESVELFDRGSRLLGRRWRWLWSLARRVSVSHQGVRPRQQTIENFILNDQGFARAYSRHRLRLNPVLMGRPRMLPIESAATWKVRSLETVGELADWLAISQKELFWFADRRQYEKRNRSKLRHYRYRALTKKCGDRRLIEIPKDRLKTIQRRILKEILDRVPLHTAAHGFRQGRSIRTFASSHPSTSKLDKPADVPTTSISRTTRWDTSRLELASARSAETS